MNLIILILSRVPESGLSADQELIIWIMIGFVAVFGALHYYSERKSLVRIFFLYFLVLIIIANYSLPIVIALSYGAVFGVIFTKILDIGEGY